MDRAELAVSQWAKERPELDGLAMAVLGRVSEAAQVIARDHFEPLFARYGLQGCDFDVLATLRRSGFPYQLRPTELYQATMVSSGTMTNRLDRLERAEFIARARNRTDRRGTTIALTDKGRQVIDEAVVAHVENEKRILAGLTRDEQLTLSGLLAKLISGLPSPSSAWP